MRGHNEGNYWMAGFHNHWRYRAQAMWLAIKAPERPVDLVMVPDGCELAVYHGGKIIYPGFLDLTETATR